ncbi:RHD3/Sey1 [Fimicolochytrium jonesii]|uniref:RHD3/Sey1 n=1 Tax=Fimicolochytrium jonesii TaxID=1396493 RepID=UPI0022FED212|nr:RHD3/Sey1 [Fimicolochytrium jonesii]KAI8823432.1 RHD3/Sey1 [Fimicolochytrium jonesii]
MADSLSVPDIDHPVNGTVSDAAQQKPALAPWKPTDPSDPRLQVVNENQEFTSDLLKYMRDKWDITKRGFDYNVVAVFGSQSTGKSTLLNRLFGTNFDVMNEVSRQQTTKGIWVSKADATNLLVMDVEGTDGRERGEDQDFERKSALFSIAIAEVLIVNMWENQVGLYNGANMGLLKTVFEVNLQLFQQKGSPKTCLFFVIRDFTGVTPISNLQTSLMKDLERIWAGLIKPAGKEDSLISDFFDFNFAGLPHKIFAGEKFEVEAKTLKSRFYDKENPTYVFQPNFHKHIPADGFPQFAEAIWEKIVTNRDLDLPTQQQLLAQYRCDEISRTAYEEFHTQVKGYRSHLESGKVLEDLGKEVVQHYNAALVAFDTDGSRYNKEVYQKKRGELKEKMASALHVYYVQQLRNLHQKAIVLFKDRLSEKMRGDDSNFARKLRESREEAENYYNRIAEATKLEDGNWSSEEYFSQFERDISQIASEKRAEAMARVVKNLDRSLQQDMVEPVQVVLNDGPADVWKQIFTIFKSTLVDADATLRKQLAGFDSSEDEISTSVREMKYQAWELLGKTIHDEFEDVKVLERLRQRFLNKFRYDETGIPRVWQAGDDIDGPFAEARDDADQLCVLYSKIDVPHAELDKAITEDERFEPSSFVVLSPAKVQSLRDRFRKEADLLFVEAKRSIVQSQVGPSKIFYLATLALGWNELWMVLTNPLLTVFTVMLLGVAYTLWRSGLAGPLIQAARHAAHQVTQNAGDNPNIANILNQARPFVNKNLTNLQGGRSASQPSLSSQGQRRRWRNDEADSDSDSVELQQQTSRSTSELSGRRSNLRDD